MRALIERRSVLQVLAMGLGVGTSFAQEWQVWDMVNSPLPSTTITALVEDEAGGIWVGTDWGLCHFDGDDSWEIFQVANSGIASNNVRALAMDGQGRLWVGTQSEGLCVLNGSTWTTFTTSNSALPESGVRDLFVDHLDRVWIATAEGLACIVGDEWRIYNATQESYGGAVLHTGNTRAVAVRSDGLVCLGTFNGGLHFINGSEVEYLTTTGNGFFDNTATDVLFDPVTGNRWVATPSAGLLRQQGPTSGGVWSQWNSSIGFPSNGLNCLDMDGQGNIWTGTQVSGVVRVAPDGAFTHFNSANSGLPDDEIPAVLAAADGSIWVGTVYGGLARFQPNVGVMEQDAHRRLLIYPNPVVDHCTVRIPGSLAGYRWRLQDSQGRLVAEGSGTDLLLDVDLGQVRAGWYFFDVRGQEAYYWSEIVVE